MKFRTRMALAATLAVALTVATASGITLLVLRRNLAAALDQTLRTRATGLAHVADTGDPDADDEAREEVNTAGGLAQIIDATGTVLAPRVPAFPVPAGAAAVAAGRTDSTIETVVARHGSTSRSVRVLTIGLGNGTALELGAPQDELESSLRVLALDLALVALGGVAAAVAVGWLVARAALVPVERLTYAIDKVAATTDLSQRIVVRGSDELARLGADFNRLLEALERSRERQRQLVADASHELRTPLTSLRTNVEVLERAPQLDPEERAALHRDILAQLEELTGLISDVVELARGETPEVQRQEIELADLVGAAVAAAQPHARAAGVLIETDLSACTVYGLPQRLQRAVANLLDNAIKWSPPGSEVSVVCARGRVVVRDHGPGIDPADLPLVFERFFRASSARGLPGSGLGLAIVREVVEAEGGTVSAGNHPGGGAVLQIALPVLDEDP